ncbi:MAG: 2-succinyl-6-hydroxy-2,4-cyclohexadiene-1-carboxylate synthase [Dehalococcoidia bacterium]
MPRMPVNGAELNVEVVGEGPPVVAVHGFTGDISTWDCFVEAARAEFTLILVDVLGHGCSEAPGDPGRYSMDHCVEDLVGVLDGIGVRRASWLGYSMGGRICLYVALNAPDRCRALVLEGASPGISNARDRRERVDRDVELARIIEERGVATFVEYWEALPLFATQQRLPQAARERLRRQRLRNNPVGLANTLRGIGVGVQPPLQDRLSCLAPPVLFVVGEKDGKFCDLARSMNAAVPNGRLAVIPEAGHAVHLEQPDRFNSIVLDFLRVCREEE